MNTSRKTAILVLFAMDFYRIRGSGGYKYRYGRADLIIGGPGNQLFNRTAVVDQAGPVALVFLDFISLLPS